MVLKNQGSGGTTIIKAGEDITIDTDNFTNNNGNIAGNGNIIVKSEKNINNNSSELWMLELYLSMVI